MRPSRGLQGRRRVLPALLVLVACAAPAARAQSSILTISGAPSAATPTISDYTNGYVCAGSVTWTASRSTGNNRTDTVFVRLSTNTPMASTVALVTKSLGDFQYNTSAASCAATTGWVSLPAYPTLAILGSGNYKNTPISGTVYFRLLLDWTKDRGGATFTLPSLDFFLNRSQTSPP